ncbi:hypothetical protein BDY17DRAFT_323059 [Neohortaea acidophila]|uniref:DUF7704 domain-containing protein n=1 Tax=Neohortaea acidophila TaxID=245834 RepID=A0A6A6PWW5_9PEZI|nr:uncharacterized protein BDY17DRAFT_323059 [Neohortaea acidophila]KAF2484189.1 hypothetical protein BDY17DRAFT_323059 [Neohortaea acidophila]
MAPSTSHRSDPLPFLYTLFFLYIEPVATASGAYMAHLQQSEYLALTWPSLRATTFGGVTAPESIVLTQLANMYAAFALSEALVLRSTTDRRVWKTFLLVLLIADFGHLYSVRLSGLEIYYRFWEWNVMDYGNILFVYVGALHRILFLLGVGLDQKRPAKTKK